MRMAESLHHMKHVHIKWWAFALMVLAVGSAQSEGLQLQTRDGLPLTSTRASKPIDLAKCSTGDRSYVYWAANRHVFQIPFNSAEPIYPTAGKAITGIHLKARHQIPAPPRPNDPEGCYGNPLRGLSMPYVKSFEAKLYEELFGRPYNSGSDGDGIYAVPLGYQSSRQRVNLESLNRHQICRDRTVNLRECTLTEQGRGNYSQAHIFILASPRLKQLGINEIHFSVQHALAPANLTVEVKSTFSLFDSVLVSLNPEIRPNELESMTIYHQKIIEFIVGSHLPSYRWDQTDR